MNCPRCESSTLAERNRGGIVVDICSQCRGVWLDRGELEKLMAQAQAVDEQAQYDSRMKYDEDDDDYRKGQSRHRDDHDHDDTPYDAQGRPRKRRWYESFTDMFD